MNQANLRLAIFSAFLGAIQAGVRAVAFDYTEDTILIYEYLDREPNKQDYEVVDIAITDIMASFPNFLKQEINLIRSEGPVGKLDAYKGWIFIRFED